MPPAFSTEERARITRVLMDNGQRLFTTQGLRKTSLDDLVRPAGIAKSSFYSFFDSKEALYLELMMAQVSCSASSPLSMTLCFTSVIWASVSSM